MDEKVKGDQIPLRQGGVRIMGSIRNDNTLDHLVPAPCPRTGEPTESKMLVIYHLIIRF